MTAAAAEGVGERGGHREGSAWRSSPVPSPQCHGLDPLQRRGLFYYLSLLLPPTFLPRTEFPSPALSLLAGSWEGCGFLGLGTGPGSGFHLELTEAGNVG